MISRQQSAIVPSGAQLPQRELVSFTVTRRARNDAAAALAATILVKRRRASARRKSVTRRPRNSGAPVTCSSPSASHAPPRACGTWRIRQGLPSIGIASPSPKRIIRGSLASRSVTQSACVISSAIPARRLARGGKVTTTMPSLGSMRRLTRRARALRRQSTRVGPPGSVNISSSGSSMVTGEVRLPRFVNSDCPCQFRGGWKRRTAGRVTPPPANPVRAAADTK